MTVPLTALQVHADDLSTRLRRLSEHAAEEAGGALRVRVGQLRADLTALWVREFGGVHLGPESPQDAERFTRMARARVEQALNPGLLDGDVVAEAIRSAHGMGADHAVDTAPVLPASLPVRADPVAPDLARRVREQTAQALSGLSEPAVETSGFTAVLAATRKAEHAVTRIESAVAWETTRAASDGVRDVANLTGSRVVWVPERDACLHCLGYAGTTATTGQPFPQGRTFDDRPLVIPEPFTGPPAHPRCRCTLEVLADSDDAIADALRREAKRSVLRGWSGSDSERARIDAAERLLALGAGMPKTVEARARAAVRAGRFTGDTVPAKPAPTRLTGEHAAEVLRPDLEPAPPALTGRIEHLTDEQLDAAMADAIEREDFDRLDELTVEADRRDATPPDTGQGDLMPGELAGDQLETSTPADLERLDTMAELIAGGMSESEAYGVAYGVASDRYARDEAIRQLRRRYDGAGFDELARQSYGDHIREQYVLAEDACRGHLLNKAGRAAGVDPLSLFSGPLARAAKYASDELKDWWEANERITFDEYREQLLHGSRSSASRFAGSGRRFER